VNVGNPAAGVRLYRWLIDTLTDSPASTATRPPFNDGRLAAFEHTATISASDGVATETGAHYLTRKEKENEKLQA
jgi:hypothetical protein